MDLNKVNLLVDFASHISLNNHQYINKKSDGGYVLTNQKEDNFDSIDFFKKMATEVENDKDVSHSREIQLSCEIIESHINKKIKGISRFFISKRDKHNMNVLLTNVQIVKQKVSGNINKGQPLTESEARLLFYHDAAKKLDIQEAPNENEQEALKILSQKIWEADPEKYQERMTAIFQGEHVLIEELQDKIGNSKYETYEKLTQLGARLRTSSHYDEGKDSQGNTPEDPSQTVNPQYEIWGDHVKELLFGRVTLAVREDNSLVYGKTFAQAANSEEGNRIPIKARHFTWFQLEGARDGQSIFDLNFWRHSIRDFVTYWVLKNILRFEKPNVGPYGFGHADICPTVIEIKKPDSQV